MDNARLRYTVAERMASYLSPPLTPGDADRLATSMTEWLAAMRSEWLRADGPQGCGDAPGATLACATLAAVTASRDLLERASAKGAPLTRFRAALAALSWPRTCEPSEDDAARAAALAHEVETDTRLHAPASTPGARCVQVPTIAGLVIAESSAAPSQRKELRVDAPRPASADQSFRRGDLEWDDATARVVPIGLYEDGGEYWSTELVVKKVGGVWRVIGDLRAGEDD
jgi:hypothetical protein